MSVGPHSEKFNMVSNDHGRTQKCDFCVLVGTTNFNVHHTPDTINVIKVSRQGNTVKIKYNSKINLQSCLVLSNNPVKQVI